MDDLERQVLDLEREHPRYNGVKDDAIRRRLNMSPTSYFQILNQLLDDPAALEADPVLINRLRRIRNGNDRTL
ncbi:Protein of uncharacterised function (DUF3263) [Brevibacterium casei]|uniref:Protein of uncharacterized function (DUF3263) n=1 Tax=Brevibacterium casei TaxID=33889 RepID=A0A449D7A6_9MICO|nr:DUF3263 domain-containing protein [Brevibacterium casei]VEW13509.1 Protein of uncharacterised function (DUF3263) [Brevibacterium casei]